MLAMRWESSRRYYAARLDQDLFGGWMVSRAWGGLFNRLGSRDSQPVADYAAGLEEMAKIDRLRKARRYQPC